MMFSAGFKKRYMTRTPISHEMSGRAGHVLPAGVVANVKFFDPYPLFMKRAKGSHLWDADGNEYIDYCLGFGPLILGHGYPAVVQAVTNSFAAAGTSLFGTPHELEIRYAEKLLSMLPVSGKVRLTNSGSEATYLALQLGAPLRASRRSPGLKAIIMAGTTRAFSAILRRSAHVARPTVRFPSPVPAGRRPPFSKTRWSFRSTIWKPAERCSRPTGTAWERSSSNHRRAHSTRRILRFSEDFVP